MLSAGLVDETMILRELAQSCWTDLTTAVSAHAA
jgi:hypothetical protein